MNATEPALARRLVERSLATANTASIGDLLQWGQYNDSRLSSHVLAYLANSQETAAILDAGTHRARLARTPLNLEALCALAASLALKARTDSERAQALELFDLAYGRLDGALPAEYRELHVMTAYLNGRRKRVDALIASYEDLPERFVDAFGCQDAHPRNGGSAREFMQRFKAFTGWHELTAADGEAPHIDALRTAPVPQVDGGPLISVIMTCFRPGESLLTAVRSVIAQSWQHWELLLVDDGSGQAHHDVLRRAAALDPRVKLLIQPENGGTYQARNRALAVAEGEFATGLDSDDWSHPLRLEKQVEALVKHPHLMMVESRSLAVHEDLSLMIDPQTATVSSRSTLIMVRTEAVRGRVGFYDEVRKTADSEYRSRVKEAFGAGAWIRMKGGPLSLVRHTEDTLSAGEVSRHWMTTSRLAYHSGFTHWHRRIADGGAEPFLEALARPRPFPITSDINRTRAQNRAVVYDRLYAADWRRLDRERRAMIEDAMAEAKRGDTIGLVHCAEWVDVDGERPLIDLEVLSLAAEHGLEFLDLEDGTTTPVVVPNETYAELLRFEHPALAADRVLVRPSAVSDNATEERPLVRTATGAPPSLVRRRDLQLALAGLFPVTATAALAAALEPDALPWAASGSLLIWVAAFSALLARRAVSRL